MVSVRAVYQNGQLKLLDPVNLNEGEEVVLQIASQRQQIINALGELVTTPTRDSKPAFGDETRLRELDELTQGVTLSDVVIEDREAGW